MRLIALILVLITPTMAAAASVYDGRKAEALVQFAKASDSILAIETGSLSQHKVFFISLTPDHVEAAQRYYRPILNDLVDGIYICHVRLRELHVASYCYRRKD